MQFTTKQASELTGVNMKTLHHWSKTGILRASVQEAKGIGTRRLYSFDDLLCLCVMHELRQMSLLLERVTMAVELLRSKLSLVDDWPYLVIGCEYEKLVRKDDLHEFLSRPLYFTSVVVNVIGLRRELTEWIEVRAA